MVPSIICSQYRALKMSHDLTYKTIQYVSKKGIKKKPQPSDILSEPWRLNFMLSTASAQTLAMLVWKGKPKMGFVFIYVKLPEVI